MLSEAIIVAIIGGVFSLTGIIITTYKCCAKKSVAEDIKDINHYYPGTPAQILNKQYGPDGGLQDSTNYLLVVNGKYLLEIGPKIKMHSSLSDGEINVFRIFTEKQKNQGYHMECLLSNVSGHVYLFVKRFDNNWKYVGNPCIETVPAGNGKNVLNISSQIGLNGVTKEQVGIMIKSDQSDRNIWGKCDVNSILLNHKFEYLI
tara:strand:+ start:357 stop:965 length:609 start_codon:yes stop_codon:yes gene_type:complete